MESASKTICRFSPSPVPFTFNFGGGIINEKIDFPFNGVATYTRPVVEQVRATEGTLNIFIA